ncbi:MAG: ABC transporter permease [Pseudomonadota bacterium]
MNADAARAVSAPRRRPALSLLAAALAVAAPALLAIGALLAAWVTPDPAPWMHLREHLLPGAGARTAVLALGTGACSALLGTAFAALVSLCDFRGRRLLEVLLVLPLAMPAYVLAYAWVASLDVGSPLRAWALAQTGSAAWLPSLRNLPGAIALLALANYAYVYLLVRARLLGGGGALLEAARSQGLAPAAAFVRGVLPALRPALAAGVALVVLESLAEFGAVSVLGVDTLSVLVYRTWYGMHALPAAAQVASLLLLFAVAVRIAEQAAAGPAHPASAARGTRAPPLRLRARATVAAWCAGGLVVALGFALPAAQLAAGAWSTRADWQRLVDPLLATAWVAGVAALAIVGAGLLVALAARAARAGAVLRDVAGLGYAVPGVVLAVGLMFALVAIERALAGAGMAALLSSSALAVWLGLLARFLRVGAAAADSGLVALQPAIGDAARSLGAGRARRAVAVQLPLLRPALAGGLLLAFVECAKELPATLMLRPFGLDTLAVRIYNATSEGLWAQAAAPSLLLCLLGLWPAVGLLRRRA